MWQNSAMVTKAPATAPAVIRAAKVLTHLAENAGAQRLSSIAGAVGIPVSSTAAICNSLEQERLVVHRAGGYLLGPRTVELGQRFIADLDPLASFAEVVSGYEALRHETVQLAVLDGPDMLYVARRDADQPFLISSAVGRRLPANCTAVGKASLALLDPDDRVVPNVLPALTKHSITDRAQLMAAIEETADRGYAIDDEEASEGIICFAVARQSPGGEVYALSATLLKSRINPELEESITDGLAGAMNGLFPVVYHPVSAG